MNRLPKTMRKAQPPPKMANPSPLALRTSAAGMIRDLALVLPQVWQTIGTKRSTAGVKNGLIFRKREEFKGLSRGSLVFIGSTFDICTRC
jgi:hypothetical protein